MDIVRLGPVLMSFQASVEDKSDDAMHTLESVVGLQIEFVLPQILVRARGKDNVL